MIPVIDLAPYLAKRPGARETTAAELGRALQDIGFFVIVNHGVRYLGWRLAKIPGSWRCSANDQDSREIPINQNDCVCGRRAINQRLPHSL